MSPEERLQKILRYRQKRQERNFNRTIKYQCRKSLADTRPRVRGRFARNNDIGIVLPHETKKAQRERMAAQAQEDAAAGAAGSTAAGSAVVAPLGPSSASPSSSSGGLVPQPEASLMHADPPPPQQPLQQHHPASGPYPEQPLQLDLQLGGDLHQQQQQQQHCTRVLVPQDLRVKQEDSLEGVFDQWSAAEFMGSHEL